MLNTITIKLARDLQGFRDLRTFAKENQLQKLCVAVVDIAYYSTLITVEHSAFAYFTLFNQHKKDLKLSSRSYCVSGTIVGAGGRKFFLEVCVFLF